MKKLIVLNKCGFTNKEKAFLKSKFRTLRFFEDTDSEDMAIKRIGDAGAIIMDQFMFNFGEKLFINCPNLKMIVVNTTAFDRIPVNVLKKYGVEIKNIPAYATEDVSETALSMIFQLNQKTAIAQRLVRQGVCDLYPEHPEIKNIVRERLSNKKAVVVGMGKIGSNILKSLNLLGMECTPFSHLKNSSLSLKNIIKDADIVIIAMAYHPGENDQVISADILSAMKNDAIIVSTSPSELIDIAWIIAHPDKFSGIGFDYFVTDKIKKLLEVRKQNIIITPHLGSQSIEAIDKMTSYLINIIVKFYRPDQTFPANFSSFG